jgi:hypothetical protein
MSDYRRTYVLGERQRFDAMLVDALAKLSAEVDKAATALDRPGGRAIRNKLVKATRWAIDLHRLAAQMQAELDEELGTDREPAQIIAFPKARSAVMRVVGEPDPLMGQAARACGRSPVRLRVDNDGGDHAA